MYSLIKRHQKKIYMVYYIGFMKEGINLNTLFKDLPLLEQTQQALEALGFAEATPIQALAIPKMIEGLDFIGQAQTGTGKTFAFAIPMIERIDTKLKKIQALILCPTRELSLQVHKEILKLIKFYPELKAAVIYGGESYDKQFKALAKNPHIVVGTPGRMIDHLERGTINLSNVTMLALDEADEMLKMGFQEDLEKILSTVPTDRQTVLFSATISPTIKRIAKKYQKNPEILAVAAQTLTVDRITQSYFEVKEEDKPKLLARLLDLEKPTSAIIFANTKKDVDTIAETLQLAKFEADALHGDLKQSQRNYVMSRFRNKLLTLLIATDVAARGLDISDVELVINYDLPHEDEVYVHRIGRTGRAGKKGKAFTFITPRKRRMISVLEQFTKSEIKRLTPPTPTDIAKKDRKRFYTNLKVLATNNEKDYTYLIEDLLKEGITHDQLLNGLIAKLEPVERVYEELDVIPEKKLRTKGERDNSRDRGRSNKGGYVTLSINLGRKDNITPVSLLEFMRKEYNLYAKNIGDIKHKDTTTTFDVKTDAMSKLRANKNVKYQGRNIQLSIVKK